MYRNVALQEVFLLVVYIHFYDFSNLTAFCTFCHIRIAFEFICDLSFKYSIALSDQARVEPKQPNRNYWLAIPGY